MYPAIHFALHVVLYTDLYCVVLHSNTGVCGYGEDVNIYLVFLTDGIQKILHVMNLQVGIQNNNLQPGLARHIPRINRNDME